MADVFLSYAKEDRTRAARIASVLESCGWSVFWDHKIRAGDDWRDVVQRELSEALAVVTLWSHASVTSGWVHDEAERGRARLVSVLIDDVSPPIGFGSLQGVNLVGWDGGRNENIGRLVEAVATVLQRPAPRAPRIPRSATQKWRLTTAVAVIVALAAGVPLVRSVLAKPPIMNQEIVLDTSSDMQSDFEGRPSKLNAAVEALRLRNLQPEENLALRTFGGDCNQKDQSRLLVPFGRNRGGRIIGVTGGLRPQGKSTLVSGVLSAFYEIQPLPHTRRIIVITGHVDDCYKEAVRELKLRFDAQPKTPAGDGAVALEMRFIGLGMSSADQARLKEIGNAVGGDVHFANTAAELNRVLEFVLEFEPAVLHVKNVWNVVDKVGKSLSDVAHRANDRNFDEAVKILDAGEHSYADLQPSFESLERVQLSVSFRRFYTLAAENRSLQAQSFAAGRAWLRLGPGLVKATPEQRDERVKEWNAAVGKWNAIVARYNHNINEMNKLTQQIVDETRRAV